MVKKKKATPMFGTQSDSKDRKLKKKGKPDSNGVKKLKENVKRHQKPLIMREPR